VSVQGESGVDGARGQARVRSISRRDNIYIIVMNVCVVRTDLSGCHWLLVLLAEQLDRRHIVPEVLLTPYEDHWYPPAEMIQFTDPLHEGNCINIVHLGQATLHTFSVTFSKESGRSMA
jgi:hypothetical protein